MLEKRRAPRCAMDDEVHLSAGGASAHPAQVMDVSPQGIRVRFDEDLDPGTPVVLSLDFLKEDQPTQTLGVSGTVMHRFAEPGGTHWQIGLKLKFDDDAQERSLLTHLASCKSTF